jgi:hypothetical protein
MVDRVGQSEERARVMLGLLESVERDSRGTQRSRALEFGIALGWVNAYLNFCIKKGYVRAKKIPARRYAYFLTPKGFSEKSRLSLMLVSNSLGSFRKARAEYCAAFQAFRARGLNRIVLVGTSELAEIATICATEQGVVLAAIVQQGVPEAELAGLPVVTSFAQVPGGFDAAVITDLRAPQATYDAATAALGVDRVISPAILGIVTQQQRREAE